MSETEAMNVDERRKYIHKMWARYREQDKKEKGRLLDEIEAVTGMHRKAIIRLLNGRLSRKKRTRERGKQYGVEVSNADQVIARSLDYPCAERLQPNLVWMAKHLCIHGELPVGKEVLEKLERVSSSTLKRILKSVEHRRARLAVQQPRRPPTNHLRKQFPMHKIAWDTLEARHFEVDLVHHGGETALGEYIHTLQMVSSVDLETSQVSMIYWLFMHILTFFLDIFTTLSVTKCNKDLEIIILRQQVRILQRKVKSPPRVSDPERIILVILTDRVSKSTKDAPQSLHQVMLIIKPDNLIRWYRELVHRKWMFER